MMKFNINLTFHFMLPYIYIYTPIQHVKKGVHVLLIGAARSFFCFQNGVAFCSQSSCSIVLRAAISKCVLVGGAIQSPRIHSHPLPTNHCPFVTSAWHDLGRGLSAIQLETPVAPTTPVSTFPLLLPASHLLDTSLMRLVLFPS